MYSDIILSGEKPTQIETGWYHSLGRNRFVCLQIKTRRKICILLAITHTEPYGKTKCYIHFYSTFQCKTAATSSSFTQQSKIYGCLINLLADPDAAAATAKAEILHLPALKPWHSPPSPPLQPLHTIDQCQTVSTNREQGHSACAPLILIASVTKKRQKQTTEKISTSQLGVARGNLQETKRKQRGGCAQQGSTVSWGKINSSSSAYPCLNLQLGQHPIISGAIFIILISYFSDIAKQHCTVSLCVRASEWKREWQRILLSRHYLKFVLNLGEGELVQSIKKKSKREHAGHIRAFQGQKMYSRWKGWWSRLRVFLSSSFTATTHI